MIDLDGVVYLGDRAVPGSPEALERLEAAGLDILFITNNSTRSPAEGAAKVERVTGYRATEDQLITSSLAAASMLSPGDSPVLVVGETGLAEAVGAEGLAVAADSTSARAVVVGLTRAFDYDTLDTAARAIRAGARFVATNTDPTYPSESGLHPGSGAIVAFLATSSGVVPEVAGKPHQPMIQLIEGRGVDDAWVVGDRLDTDIALARDKPEWRSVLVASGVTEIGEEGEVDPDFRASDLSDAADVIIRQHQTA